MLHSPVDALLLRFETQIKPHIDSTSMIVDQKKIDRTLQDLDTYSFNLFNWGRLLYIHRLGDSKASRRE